MNDGATRIDRLEAELADEILTARMKRGEAIPSERELAQRYQLNRATIRLAIQRLVGKGLVTPALGMATRVSERAWGLDLLLDCVWAQRRHPEGVKLLADFLALRTMLIGEMAACACERANDDDRVSVRLFVSDLGHQLRRGAHYTDIRFAERELLATLIGCARNSALSMLFASFDRLFEVFPPLEVAMARSDTLAHLDALTELVDRRAAGEARALLVTAYQQSDRRLIAAFEKMVQNEAATAESAAR